MRQAVEIGDSKSIDFSDVKDGAYAEVEAQYDGTMGESVEQATLSTCGERPTEDMVGNKAATIVDSEEGRCFWT